VLALQLIRGERLYDKTKPGFVRGLHRSYGDENP
jgi:hypothetical protein